MLNIRRILLGEIYWTSSAEGGGIMLAQLLNRIDSYLLLHCTLRDLEAWLLSNLQRILDSGEDTAIDLANEVDVDLVELGEDLIDELTFRERLQSYIRSGDTLLVQSQPNHTSSIYTTYEHEWAPKALPQQQHLGWKYVDIELGTAS